MCFSSEAKEPGLPGPLVALGFVWGGWGLFYSGTAVPRVCSEWTRLTQVSMDKSVRMEGSVSRPLLPPKPDQLTGPGPAALRTRS